MLQLCSICLFACSAKIILYTLNLIFGIGFIFIICRMRQKGNKHITIMKCELIARTTAFDMKYLFRSRQYFFL